MQETADKSNRLKNSLPEDNLVKQENIKIHGIGLDKAGPEEAYPVLCGNCGRKLTLQEYKKGSCPYCHAGFNPKCSLHENIYFCCTM